MFDLGSKQGRRKLHERIEHSEEKIKPYRQTREKAISQYVGEYYPQDKTVTEFSIIANFLNQAIETYVLLLAGGRLRALVSTAEEGLKHTRKRLQVAINNTIREIHLEETRCQIILDAMFRVGIAKVYMAEGRQAEIDNDVWIEIGRPYVKRVSLDDFVYDTSQRRWSEIRFACDQYEVPWEDLRGDDFYNQRAVGQLLPSKGRQVALGGEDRARDLSTGIISDPAYSEEYVTLRDVWLPEKGQVAVMAAYDPELIPLAVVDWEGPEEGPYPLLYMGDVPDNIMPISATDQIMPVHETLNRLLTKLVGQAENQKTLYPYTGAGKDDMTRVVGGKDQATVKVNSLADIGQPFETGGANQGNLGFAIQMEKLFDRGAGNLQALAGLGPQSGTLGQDELIHGQISRKLGKYMEKVVDFDKKIVTAMAHFIWYDDINIVPGEYEIPGVGSIPYEWSSEHREGDFVDFHLSVDLSSTAYESPEAKLAKLERAMDRMLELWPAIQQEGGVLNTQEIVNDYAELGDMYRMKRWITYGREPQMGGREETRQAPRTERTNIRKNVSAGPTNEEGNRIMADMLSGSPQSNRQQQGAVALGG